MRCVDDMAVLPPSKEKIRTATQQPCLPGSIYDYTAQKCVPAPSPPPPTGGLEAQPRSKLDTNKLTTTTTTNPSTLTQAAPIQQPSQPECVPGFHWDSSQKQCVK
jgi:hypothetical protein